MSVEPGDSGLPLFDAHCHLYDANLLPVLDWDSNQSGLPLIGAHVINGTHPDDWGLIADYPGLGESRPLRAFGVHPWRVDDLPDNWEQQLHQYLSKGAVSVGEIGLDNWITPRDESLQREVFMRQMVIAVELGLPPSIHCVRAYGALLDCLRSGPVPKGGFLAHGFGGSKEVLFEFLDMGGYFSFSSYGSHPGRKRIRDAVRACPVDRLLIETDAPDMVPPEDVCQFPLISQSGERLHHPAELLTAYQRVAEWKGMKVDELAQQIEENFRRLFGHLESF